MPSMMFFWRFCVASPAPVLSSASELADAIKSRKLSSKAIVEAHVRGLRGDINLDDGGEFLQIFGCTDDHIASSSCEEREKQA